MHLRGPFFRGLHVVDEARIPNRLIPLASGRFFVLVSLFPRGRWERREIFRGKGRSPGEVEITGTSLGFTSLRAFGLLNPGGARLLASR